MKTIIKLFCVFAIFKMVACQCEDVVPTEPTFAELVAVSIDSMDVDCFGQPVKCTTEVVVTIANLGDADSGPFNVQFIMDPNQLMVVDFPVLSLAAGEYRQIKVVSGEGGNCYDPNCLINVLVDSKDEIKELNEENNSLFREYNG